MVLRSLLISLGGHLKSRNAVNGLGGLAIRPETPHIWRSYVGFSDMDLNFHMNQSSFLYTAELARWHFLAQTGLLAKSLEKGWKFIAASQSIKYKKEIKPFGRYQVVTSIEAVDKELGWVYLTQRHTNMDSSVLYSFMSFRLCVTNKEGKKLKADEWLNQSLYSTEEREIIFAKHISDSKTVSSFIEWDNQVYSAIKQGHL